jgi:tRNA(adenine34) deaminase
MTIKIPYFFSCLAESSNLITQRNAKINLMYPAGRGKIIPGLVCGEAMDRDEEYMREALTEAQSAWEAGEVPIGAIIVEEEKIIARGHNSPIGTCDSTSHAEIVAIRRACREKGNYRLSGCDLYVTVEPCAMCLGAMVNARIKRLVYGALDPKAGAVISVMSFPLEKMNHRFAIKGGILALECGKILKSFFDNRRKGLVG